MEDLEDLPYIFGQVHQNIFFIQIGLNLSNSARNHVFEILEFWVCKGFWGSLGVPYIFGRIHQNNFFS